MRLTSLSPPSLPTSLPKLPACVNIPRQGGLLREFIRSESLPWFESLSCGYRCAQLLAPLTCVVTRDWADDDDDDEEDDSEREEEASLHNDSQDVI